MMNILKLTTYSFDPFLSVDMHLLWALTVFATTSLGIPFLDSSSSNSQNPTPLEILPRADVDPSDLSYVSKWAALGDSYARRHNYFPRTFILTAIAKKAAGIGAGKPLGDLLHHDDWSCSRWDGAYPNLMNQMEGFTDKDFKFLACSGWTSVQIKDKQVPMLDDKSQQVITLSAGGNDVYLSELLDACVYQITPGAAIGDNCKKVMDKSLEAIDKELFGWLDALYGSLKSKLTDDGKIYVTGYAQFWNSNTKQCDDVSW